ncbi:MAG: hypothetical protein ACREVE_08910 [Gammaproteobacteria bacterium]
MATSSGSSVARLRYGIEDGRLLSTPVDFVKHGEGGRSHPLVGLAFGPDGLYFAPIYPVRGNKGAVLKVKYEPENPHPVTLAQLASLAPRDIKNLMEEKGCFGCHRLKDVIEVGGTQGPVLDQGDGPMVDRILQRISSQE